MNFSIFQFITISIAFIIIASAINITTAPKSRAANND